MVDDLVNASDNGNASANGSDTSFLWDRDPGTFNWSFICVLVFVFAGTLGNVLVCLAVWLERPLQNVTNWFLVSLAFADLIVSTIVMPFGATAAFLGYWPLGPTWCNVYVTCDVLACSASILHMCCISLGRYLGIRSPLKARGYGGRGGGSSYLTGGSSKRMVVIRVVLVWLLALLISSPISALGLMDMDNIMIGDQCVINHRGFAFFGSLAAFYVPMIIMVVSYALTVQLLRSKARQHQQAMMQRVSGGGTRSGTGKRSFNSGGVASSPAEDHGSIQLHERGTQTPANVSRERRRLVWKARISFTRNENEQPVRVVKPSNVATNSNRDQPKTDGGGGGGNRSVSRSRQVSTTSSGGAAGSGESQRGSQRSVSPRLSTHNISSAATVANEQKASKVLGVVFFTFVLCWAPFFLLNLLMAVWPSSGDYIPPRLVATCLWLGYVSSTINPLIYTVFNRTFKRVFIRLLKCQCRKSPSGPPVITAAPTALAISNSAPMATVHRYSRCTSVYDGLQQHQSAVPTHNSRYR